MVAVVAVVAGYFGFLPETNFCFSSLIQASISLRMPVSAHSSQAFPGSLSRFLNEPDFHPRPAASSARFVRIRNRDCQFVSHRECNVLKEPALAASHPSQRDFRADGWNDVPIVAMSGPHSRHSAWASVQNRTVKTVPAGQSSSPDLPIWELNGRCEASHIFGFTTAGSAFVVQDWGGAAFWLALCQAGRQALQVVRDLCWQEKLNS